MTTALQVILAVIAAVVAVGLGQKKNVWWLIFTYWLTLTMKNMIEVFK